MDFPSMTPCWGNAILLIRASQQLPYLGLGELFGLTHQSTRALSLPCALLLELNRFEEEKRHN